MEVHGGLSSGFGRPCIQISNGFILTAVGLPICACLPAAVYVFKGLTDFYTSSKARALGSPKGSLVKLVHIFLLGISNKLLYS